MTVRSYFLISFFCVLLFPKPLWSSSPKIYKQLTGVIDIRTTYKIAEIDDIDAHTVKLKDEVMRIIKANIKDPDSTHQLLLPVRERDLSDKNNGLGRWVIDVQLKAWG